MGKIDPKNLTAQLEHLSRGNPPSTLPNAAVSNCFPGLEFDFRNIWRRIFVGIELHEAWPQVVKVDEDSNGEVKRLLNYYLRSVDQEQIWVQLIGPKAEVEGEPKPPPGDINLGEDSLEWANALATIVQKAGKDVQCTFALVKNGQITDTKQISLRVRPLLELRKINGETEQYLPVISKEIAKPGEMTQSLCSPWQNDYKECACYYWAASRPDFVNVEEKEEGGSRTTVGHNWLHKRDKSTPKYSLKNIDLVTYEELFRNWEKMLKFIREGKDDE